ncbi:MAG: hypothetical protein R3248_10920 [Candidatus Promineifilaceae bacterium]|nr:hypothetical protein [Candidatus Promineifilaceae bacterium]
MKAVSRTKRNSSIFLGMVALLALGLVLFATAEIASANGPVLRIKDDVETVLGEPPDNYCTGEPMDAHGDVVLLFYESANGISVHVNAAGVTMTGENTGTLYHYNMAYNEMVSSDDDGYHWVYHVSWFSPSNDDAFIITYVSHTTVDGNGDITVDFDLVSGGCM